jgi:phasin protein
MTTSRARTSNEMSPFPFFARDMSPFPFLARSLDNPFSAAMDGGRSIFEKGFRSLNEEALRFVNQRLEHTSRTLEQYRNCHSPAEFASAQQEWFAETVRDFYGETLRVSETIRKMMVDGFSLNGSEAGGHTTTDAKAGSADKPNPAAAPRT